MSNIPFLNILHNMEPVKDVENFNLFPPEYDGEFIGSTYSVSPEYISQKLSHFEKISIIIGIKDDDYQSQMINKIYYAESIKNILSLENVSFFNKLDSKSQEMVISRKINILSPQYTIHSKFFLLTNKNKSIFRLIIGSANLTSTALNSKIPQFEDIQVIDNNKEIYEYYLERFNTIKNYTFNFITDAFIKKIKDIKKNNLKATRENIRDSTNVIVISSLEKEDSNHINSEDLNKLQKPIFMHLNDDEKSLLINQNISEFQTSLEKKVEDKILPEDTMELLKNSNLDEQKREIKNYELVYKLSKQLITPSKKNNVFKLEKSIPTIEKIVRKIIVPSIESDTFSHIDRFNLKRLDNHINSFENIEGGVIKVKDNNVEPYSKYASKEEIMKGLKNIDYLIRGYEKYLSHYDDETGKKIFEIILYSFTSPFISLIRKSITNNEKRQHIPMFMFIGGIGGSGKSSVLRFISKMMKDDNTVKDFIDYSRISTHPTPSTKTTETKTNILEMLKENNVFPLLIDEIPQVFFENKNMGEDIIKQTSGVIDEILENYPALIGTTNCSNYSMEEGGIRRSYYIKLDTPFKDNLRSESSNYHENILNNLTTDLFKDFCCKFHESILDVNIDYLKNDSDGLVDFLILSREIFKKYYEEAEMPLPRYFGENRLNDYKKSSKEKWKDLFESEHSNTSIFQYNKNGFIFFTPSELNKNQKLHQERLADSYINALPSYLAQKENSSYKIRISSQEFFEWLGIKNPYKKILGIF